MGAARGWCGPRAGPRLHPPLAAGAATCALRSLACGLRRCRAPSAGRADRGTHATQGSEVVYIHFIYASRARRAAAARRAVRAALEPDLLARWPPWACAALSWPRCVSLPVPYLPVPRTSPDPSQLHATAGRVAGSDEESDGPRVSSPSGPPAQRPDAEGNKHSTRG
jgi:hypothetical protein